MIASGRLVRGGLFDHPALSGSNNTSRLPRPAPVNPSALSSMMWIEDVRVP